MYTCFQNLIVFYIPNTWRYCKSPKSKFLKANDKGEKLMFKIEFSIITDNRGK